MSQKWPIGTNFCYFGCQLVQAVVAPLHDISHSGREQPPKSGAAAPFTASVPGRREPKLRHWAGVRGRDGGMSGD